MFLVKRWQRLYLASIQWVQRIVKKKPVAWGLVILVSVLFMFPYTIHGLDIWVLGPYTVLSLLPITIGSLLRARNGALVAWLLTMSGFLVATLVYLRFSWHDWQLALPCVALSELVIALVSGHLRSLSLQLHRAYVGVEAAHVIIQMQVLTDGLTGLPNHGAVVEQIEAELQHCQTSQRNCAIIFVDVDHFKHINDTWGHAAGDAVLQEVGQRLRRGIRKDDCVGRYGGEEFALLFSNIEQSEAFELAERLCCSIAEVPCLWRREGTQALTSIPLTASFGLATYPLDGLTARELLDTADAAMYIAKHTGRNRVCLPGEVDMAQLQGDKNQQLSQYTEQSILQTISTMAAFHDQETQAHADRMIQLAEATMSVLGRSEDEIVLLRLAAQLHDIGKIGIPEAIVQKPGPLTEEEWTVMRRHPQIGQQILIQARGQFGLVSHIIIAHHERWDGRGYPYRLAQQEIPLGARILSVIDAYDAMTSTRPYREALSEAVARAELLRGAGTQFDPQVVDAFLQILQSQASQVSIVPASVSL